MENFWLIIVVVVIFRSILWILQGSGGQRVPRPREIPPRRRETPPARIPGGEEVEYRPNIPDYLKRRRDEPAAGGAAPVEDKMAARPAGKSTAAPVERRRKRLREETRTPAAAAMNQCPHENMRRDGTAEDERKELTQRHGRIRNDNLLNDQIGPGELVKGIVWSQILGPRGGLRAGRR